MADLQYLSEKDARRGADSLEDSASDDDDLPNLNGDIVYHIVKYISDRDSLYNWLLINGYVAVGPPKGSSRVITEDQENRYAREQALGLQTGEIYPEFKKKYLELVTRCAAQTLTAVEMIHRIKTGLRKAGKRTRMTERTKTKLDELEEVVQTYTFQSFCKDLLVRMGGESAFLTFIDKNPQISDGLENLQVNLMGISKNYFSLKRKHSRDALKAITMVVYKHMLIAGRFGRFVVADWSRKIYPFRRIATQDPDYNFGHDPYDVYEILFTILDNHTLWMFHDPMHYIKGVDDEVKTSKWDELYAVCIKFAYKYAPKGSTFYPYSALPAVDVSLRLYHYHIHFARMMLNFNASEENRDPEQAKKMYSPDTIVMTFGKGVVYLPNTDPKHVANFRGHIRTYHMAYSAYDTAETELFLKYGDLYKMMCEDFTYTDYMCRNAEKYVWAVYHIFPDYTMYPILLAWKRRREALAGRKEYPKAREWMESVLTKSKSILSKRRKEKQSGCPLYLDFLKCEELVKELSTYRRYDYD